MLPENHRCESVLAEKADPTWFKEGDAEVTLGEPLDEVQAGGVDSEDEISGSTGGDQHAIDSDDSDSPDGQEESDPAGSSDRGSGVEYPTETATPPTPAHSQDDTATAYTVEEANQSRLSLPDSITWMGTRLYQLFSDLLRVGSILAIWVGAGLVGWLLLTSATLGVVLQAVGLVAGGFAGLYMTTR